MHSKGRDRGQLRQGLHNAVRECSPARAEQTGRMDTVTNFARHFSHPVASAGISATLTSEWEGISEEWGERNEGWRINARVEHRA